MLLVFMLGVIVKSDNGFVIGWYDKINDLAFVFNEIYCYIFKIIY